MWHYKKQWNDTGDK